MQVVPVLATKPRRQVSMFLSVVDRKKQVLARERMCVCDAGRLTHRWRHRKRSPEPLSFLPSYWSFCFQINMEYCIYYCRTKSSLPLVLRRSEEVFTKRGVSVYIRVCVYTYMYIRICIVYICICMQIYM